LTDKYSQEYGFFWYINRDIYVDFDIYNIINAEITDAFNDPKEQFLRAFKRKYTSETNPPSNMALEILSLGKLARLYKGLKNEKGKTEIANEFNLPSSTLTSWIVYLANVRNICAHHSRLWNKKVTADRPVLPNREKYKFKGENFDDTNTTLYGIISIANRLLSSFNSPNSFIEKIEMLIDENSIDATLMGFPTNWKETANWKME
jgi:abortive infection bacteriophage resistance protein